MALSPGSRGGPWLKSLFLVVILLAASIPTVVVVTGDSPPDLTSMQVGELSPGDCLALETAPDILAGKLARLRQDVNDTADEVEEAAGSEVEEADPTHTLRDRAGEDEDVPLLCPQGNETASRELAAAGNELLRGLNQALAVLDGRIEELEGTGIIPYLLENFTSPRHGGLGDWEPRANGDKTGFREPIDTRVGPGFALTDAPGQGYEHGLNGTLVFPMLDLGGTAVDPDLVELPNRVRTVIDSRLPKPGFTELPGQDCITIPIFGQSTPACNQEAAEGTWDTYRAVREAYLETGDRVVQAWLETARVGTLEIRHRFNLADGLDGVRFEVLTQAPPRSGAVPSGEPLWPLDDSPRRGWDNVSALAGAPGFTGSSEGWVVERFDLSPWAGQRIWILARAVTVPTFGIPDFFEDSSLFDTPNHLGYSLGGAYVNGSALPENLRVVRVTAGEIRLDGEDTIPRPLEGRTVRVAVTNHGLEPATARVTLEQCQQRTCTQPRQIGVVDLDPGEVAEVGTPFPETSATGRFTVRATVEDAGDDPSADARPEDNVLEKQLLVKTIQRVTVQQAPGTTLGLQARPDTGAPQDPRTVRLRVSNAGNVPVSGQAILEVTDAETGALVGGAITDGAERTLRLGVGETREASWKVLPGSSGIFRAEAHLDLGSIDVRGPDPVVHLFAERSPGVVCAEDLDTVRRCGQSWARVTDLPGDDRDAEQVESVARGPDGTVYALHRNGSIARFDGTAWRHIGSASSADRLIGTPEGVLAIGRSNQVTLVDRQGTTAGPSAPLSRIQVHATDAEGQLITAGRAAGGIGVAVTDGASWTLSLLDRDSLPDHGSSEVAAVSPVGDGSIALAILHEADTGDLTVRVHLAEGGSGLFPFRKIGEPVQVSPDAEGEPPTISLAPGGNGTVLVLDNVVMADRHGGCIDSNDSTGDLCGYWVWTDQRAKRTMRTLTLPQGFTNEPVDVLAGTGWLRTSGSDAKLFRITPTERSPQVEVVILSPEHGGEGLRALGGGPGSALAISGQTVLEARTPPPYLANQGDWATGVHLRPQTDGVAWSTVVMDQVGLGAPSGPTRTEWLRGTCAGQTTASVGNLDPGDPTGLGTCLLVGDLDEPGFEHLNLTYRYNLRALGEEPVEVRILLEPGTTPRTDRHAGITPSGPGGIRAFQLSGETRDRDDAIPGVEQRLEARPQTVTVHRLTRPTSAHWATETLELGKALRQMGSLPDTTGLLGVEFVFPAGTEMALDDVWLNITKFRKDAPAPDPLLHTTGGPAGAEDGTWRAWPAASLKTHRGDPTPYLVAMDGSSLKTILRSAEDTAIHGAWRPSGITESPGWAYMGAGDDVKLKADSLDRFDRLVTPVVDLRQAREPRLTFEHAYAFPTTSGDPQLPRGAGWVEVQIETAPGQWSDWQPLTPEAGYPAPPKSGSEVVEGYEDLLGYWGQTVQRDRNNAFKAILDDENLEQATVNLATQEAVLMGKRVRFAFSVFIDGSASTAGHQGWVVSNLQVHGTPRPAVDLAVRDLRFSEGYNVSLTGLPPGGEVGLNVTLENPGRFETAGGLLRWELVGIGSREQVVASGATPLSSIQPGKTTWVEMPVRVPSGLDEEAFGLEPATYLRVVFQPGAAPDEDPSNNVALLGSPAQPFPLRATEDLEVSLEVVPAQGSPNRPRLLDARLTNTGNVPLSGITVEREILEERGALGARELPGQSRTLVTTAELPAGENRTLAQLIPGLSLADRLWTPQRPGSFIVSLAASVNDVSDGIQVPVLSAEPLLRSSVEAPTTGAATKGELQPGSGWAPTGPGAFGTSQAWTFQAGEGDSSLGEGTYTLGTPTVDLSQAKKASLSIAHRYEIEELFDGGRVEASLDGGQSWHPLEPTENRTASAYGEVLGGNPLADGNLTIRGFTGNSSGQGFEGWVLSTFDLGQLPGSREPGEVARHTMESITGTSSQELPAPPSRQGPENVYAHPSWLRGSLAAGEAFLVENNTEALEDRDPPGFLYSGSVKEAWEETLDASGQGWSSAIAFTIELPELEEGQEAKIEWWEWAPLAGATGKDTQTWFQHLQWARGVHAGTRTTGDCHDSSFDIVTLDVDRAWRHYEADVTEAARTSSEVTIVFQWTPWKAASGGGWEPSSHFGGEHHPGIIVDGLNLRVFNEQRGNEVNPRVVWEEEWGSGDQVYFRPDPSSPPGKCVMGIFDTSSNPQPSVPAALMREEQDPPDVAAPWHVVERPNEETRKNRVLSSSPPAAQERRIFDVSPFMDSRLVLPALDLRGAGEDLSLAFDHRPFFYKAAKGLSGGVVEASVFDPVTGEWGPWNQIYGKSTEDNPHRGYPVREVFDLPATDPTPTNGLNGANLLPFELHEESPNRRSIFLYSASGDWPAWGRESFDLSEFAGERVRLAFHAYHQHVCTFESNYAPGATRDTDCPPGGERWLLDNITVNGQVFSGQPVQLRFVTGLDASVHDSTWAVDEIEVIGPSYKKNAGIYLDARPDELAPGAAATVSGVIRNLGTDVRRDLALMACIEPASSSQACAAGVTAGLDLSILSGKTEAIKQITSDRFDLPVSGTVPFTLNLTIPPGVAPGHQTLRLELQQWNEATGTLGILAGEEVTTNTRRLVGLDVTDRGLTLTKLTVSPSRVLSGGEAKLSLAVNNPSPEADPVRVTCEVKRIENWLPTVHDGTGVEDTPVLSDVSVPCDRQDPEWVTVRADERLLDFRATLEDSGAYLASFEVFQEGNDRTPIASTETILWSGQGPLPMFESFEELAWRFGGTNPGWDIDGDWVATLEEAARGNASLLSGISSQAYANGGNYVSLNDDQGDRVERLESRPVDLHNVTEGPAQLSIYHMARLAKGDGADVQARILTNEGAPGDQQNGWTGWCKLEPAGGYQGRVYSYHVNESSGGGGGGGDFARVGELAGSFEGPEGPDTESPSPDYNPALPANSGELSGKPTGRYHKAGFFGTTETSAGELIPRWDEAWQLAAFPLTEPDGAPMGCEGHDYVGRTIQLAFTLYKGESDEGPHDGRDPDPLERGRGQGWFLDSVVVVGSDTAVTPITLKAPILDAAPKRFPVQLTNDGPATEYGRLAVDFSKSSVRSTLISAGAPLVAERNNSTVGTFQVELPRDPLALPFEHTVVARVDGLINPNAQTEAVYNLRFDPRIWPDLSVEILEPNEPPVEGVPSLVPIRITNHGKAMAPPTELTLRDVTTNETIGETIQVPAIPPVTRDPLEATTVVFASWTPARGAQGEHVLEAQIDPQGKVQEFTKTDNSARRTLKVGALLIPDIAFDETNLTVQSPAGDVDLEERGTLRTFNVVADAPVTVEIPVLNRGSAPALNVDVRLILGNLPLPAKRIDRLDPGESSVVSFTFVAREGARELQLEASSSSRDLVPGDNRAPLSGALNLVAETFRVDATGPDLIELQEPGTVRDVTVTLENRGVRGVLLALSTQAPRGLSYDLETDRVFLGAHDRVEVPGTVEVSPVLPGGTHSVAVTVQAVDDATQTVETRVPVHLAEKHDLSATLAETTISPGPGQLDLQLTNEGNLQERLTLVPTIEGAAVGPSSEVTLPRDTTRTVSLSLDVPAELPPGTHELTLQANGTHQQRWSFQVDLSELARPVVQSDQAGASFGPDGLTVPLILSNLGNLATTGELQVDPTANAPGARVIPSTVEIPAGGHAEARLVIPSPSGVDTLPLVLRTSQGATTTTAVGLPQGRPDTRITQHSLEPTNPVPGEPSELRVTVANTGSVEAQNVPVDLFVNDEFALRTTVEALAAGASRTVSFQWPAFQGSHALMAVVNPGGEVPDEDPSNNAVTTLAQSQGSADALSRLADGLREVPAPGFPLLLTALALALALLGRRPHRPGGSRP